MRFCCTETLLLIFRNIALRRVKLVSFPYLFCVFCKQWFRGKLTLSFKHVPDVKLLSSFFAVSPDRHCQTPRHNLLTHVPGCMSNESQWEMSVCCSFLLNSTCLWCYLQVNCKTRLISLFYVICWNTLPGTW